MFTKEQEGVTNRVATNILNKYSHISTVFTQVFQSTHVHARIFKIELGPC